METTTITASLFRPFDDNVDRFSGKLEIERYRALNFKCECPFDEDQKILNWLFEATNAPNELLCEEQAWIVGVFYQAKECSISVGDVIQLNDRFYACKPIGWEKIENFQTSYNLD
jgi:hypothetical protein